MKKIHNILKEFSDNELAFFTKNRISEYMPETQTAINKYLLERGLTQSDLKKLTTEKPKEYGDNKIHCSICNSKKLIKTRVKWEIPAFKAGYEDEVALWNELVNGQATYKDKVECFVCGNVLHDPNNEKRNLIQKIIDIVFDKPLPI